MKKFFTLMLIIATAALTGGIYGALHDQLTYTISPEYYTKFKFIQFELVDDDIKTPAPNPRAWVAAVGFLATWWMGGAIGFVLGLVGLIHPDWTTMLRVTLRAFLVTIIIAFTTGVFGLLYGYLFLTEESKESFKNWFIPDNITNFASFVCVGAMHNFSYLGGLIGLVVGVGYSLRRKQQLAKLAVV